MSSFVLVHSPLVGPYTWQPVSEELRRRGHLAVVPRLNNSPRTGRSYLEEHSRDIAEAAAGLGEKRVVLVAHSGGGMLLPYAGSRLKRCSGYIFVDAALPHHGKSRLDLFGPEEAAQFRARAINGMIPPWTEEMLVGLLPDDGVRRRFAGDLAPMPLAVYEEPILVPAGWPDAPCGYLRFTGGDTYLPDYLEAQRRGWAVEEFAGHHFAMLVDPPAVAQRLEALTHLMDKAQAGDPQ